MGHMRINMPNITLSVDEETIKKVRKIAIDKDTTLTAMVREYLESVADSDVATKKQAVIRLQQSFQKLSRNMGPRSWTRDDLYER
jgi:ribosome recycling factor